MTLNLYPPNRAHFLRGNLTKGLLYSRIGQLLKMVEVRNVRLRHLEEVLPSLERRIRALERDITDLQHTTIERKP